MVITKSISRFARNTLDTLKYVRTLKEKNIAVFFEDEKINTLSMDGELLLVVLSSVAQQEVVDGELHGRGQDGGKAPQRCGQRAAQWHGGERGGAVREHDGEDGAVFAGVHGGPPGA